MLELTQVSKRYGSAAALAPTDLTVPTGKTTVLIGPSGCGKSTILRLVAGLVSMDSGSIHVGGTRLTGANLDDMRRRMGYVIQEGGLFPHLPVRRNVTLMAEHLAWPAARIEQRLESLTEMVRLSREQWSRYPVELSGGQRQRVSLMRALMLDPDLLLLDEPLGALDPMIRFDLQRELRSIFERLGKTVLLVTHDLAEAAFLGDRLVLMRDGRIVQQGSLRQLVEGPADPFVERFIGAQREPMRRLAGELA